MRSAQRSRTYVCSGAVITPNLANRPAMTRDAVEILRMYLIAMSRCANQAAAQRKNPGLSGVSASDLTNTPSTKIRQTTGRIYERASNPTFGRRRLAVSAGSRVLSATNLAQLATAIRPRGDASDASSFSKLFYSSTLATRRTPRSLANKPALATTSIPLRTGSRPELRCDCAPLGAAQSRSYPVRFSDCERARSTIKRARCPSSDSSRRAAPAHCLHAPATSHVPHAVLPRNEAR